MNFSILALRVSVCTVENGIAVGTVERCEEGLGLRRGVERRGQIVRHGGGALRGISGVPASIRPGAFDLFQAGRGHRFGLDQALGRLAVDLGPFAGRCPRGETDQPRGFVETVELSVDPAVGQRHLDGFGLAHGRTARSFLVELEPDSLRRCALRRQPVRPLRPGFKGLDGKAFVRHAPLYHALTFESDSPFPAFPFRHARSAPLSRNFRLSCSFVQPLRGPVAAGRQAVMAVEQF